MVLRRRGWRIVTLAAASFAAAGALPGSADAQGNLVWGGHVPPPPRAGEEAVYVPSPAYGSEPTYQAPNQSNFSHIQPTPPQFLPPPVEAAPAAVPVPPAALPTTATAAVPPASVPGPGDYGRTYPVAPAPAASIPAPAPVQEAALPPLGPGRVIDDSSPAGVYGSRPEEDFDPWEGLTDVTPGAEPPPPVAAPAPAPAPASQAPAVPSYAALERSAPPQAERRGWSWNPFRWGRGSLEGRTPQGYRALPREEAACRRELQRHGVEFTDANSVGDGRTHGIQYPVRVTMAAKDIAMRPAALLSCGTALQTARWLDNEVRPAARWTLWKRPAAVINASSYRVSRIAGSRTISEHALGNALDIRGLRFTDGSTFLVEPKGAFSPLEKKFQNQIRVAGCQYFGTVLGPGYNKAHDDHFHFDVKARMRPVCK